MKGLFRTHQFNKVEQVIICKPEDSQKLHEELVKNGEEILKALKIPYRVVNVCTGDLGLVAAKKYDTENFTKGTIGECDFIEKEINFDKSLKIIDVGIINSVPT